jgi:hypothetical protein
LVPGSTRVPNPATGNTALRTRLSVISSFPVFSFGLHSHRP